MDLNNREEINKIDSQNVLGSVEALPKQLEHAWTMASAVEIPDSYKSFDSVVMCGMGGSGLGARFIESVFYKDLNVPLIRINDYDLPPFVNERTLVFCSSYSGNTEETVENAMQAEAKNALWMTIGTGGELLELANESNVPSYKIEPAYNPSNQPRMAIGYSVVGQLALAHKVGLVIITDELIKQTKETMEQVVAKNGVEIPEKDNHAKKLARQLYQKIVLFIAAKELSGPLHTVNNQFNENAKVFTADYIIPELNHHLMEGLKHPTKNKESLFAFVVNSMLYPEKTRKRMEITRDVIAQNGINEYVFTPESSTLFSQAFELIQFGAYVNFYLAMLYGQDPAPITWVDYFKEQLAK